MNQQQRVATQQKQHRDERLTESHSSHGSRVPLWDVRIKGWWTTEHYTNQRAGETKVGKFKRSDFVMLKTASTTTTKKIEWPHTTEATTRNERLTSMHVGHSSCVPIWDVRIKDRSSIEHCPSSMEPNQSQPNKKKKNNKTKKKSAWEKYLIETKK